MLRLGGHTLFVEKPWDTRRAEDNTVDCKTFFMVKMIAIIDKNIYHSLLKDLEVWESPLSGTRSIRVRLLRSALQIREAFRALR